MSTDVFLPAPRRAPEECFRPGDPVVISPQDEGVALSCAGCETAVTLPLYPVTPLLDAVGDFVSRHTACR